MSEKHLYWLAALVLVAALVWLAPMLWFTLFFHGEGPEFRSG